MTGQRNHSVLSRNAHGEPPGRRRGSLRHSGAHSARSASGPAALLTIAEVLTELQVARSTFDTWRGLGAAPECIKLPNGQIRIRRCALDSWLASHSDKEAI
jgi:predicted DNA-binding transcriptional regulator AlpA